MMKHILDVREEIYDYFHGSSECQKYFFRSDGEGLVDIVSNDDIIKTNSEDAYAAYYTSMYLIKDTGEAIFSHMDKGFATDPWQAYIEFWGVMQALFIQQDAICELHKAVKGEKLEKKNEPEKFRAWNELRDFRNLCAGHPAKRGSGMPKRTFMGRSFGTYSAIKYEK